MVPYWLLGIWNLPVLGTIEEKGNEIWDGLAILQNGNCKMSL